MANPIPFLGRIFTRDHIVWTLGLVGSVATYIASNVGYLPAKYQPIAAAVAVVCAKLGTSPLPSLLDRFLGH